jgi:phosphoglycolate phosphatase
MIVSRLKLVIFDLDGTLVNSGPTVFKILNTMRLDYGLEKLNYKNFSGYLSLGGREIIERAFNDCGSHAYFDYLLEFRQRYANHSLKDEELFPGAKVILSKLKLAGIKIALCTNKPRIIVNKTLLFHEIIDYFDAIVADGDGFNLKPSTEGLKYLFEYFGVGVDELIFVGDSLADQIAANRANIPFYFHYNGYNDGVIESLCYAKFRNFFEILGVIK